MIEQLQVTSKSMNLNGGSCDILLAPFVDEQKEACEITPSVCIDILNNLFLHLDPEACVRKDIVVASLSSLLKIDHDHKCSVMVGCVLHSSGELMMEVEMTGDGLTSTFHILVTDNLQVVQRLLEEYGYRKEKHTIEESFGELDTLDETQDMFSDDEDEDEDDE